MDKKMDKQLLAKNVSKFINSLPESDYELYLDKGGNFDGKILIISDRKSKNF